MNKIVIGIGCDAAQELAAEVLKYSIEQHSHASPEIVKLHKTSIWHEISLKLKGQQRTPFSFQRFLLAKYMLDTGASIAIYFDSDMLVLQPIERLVENFISSSFNTATVVPLKEWRRRHQSSVMICNRLGAKHLWMSFEKFLAGNITYDELIYLKTVEEIGKLDYTWNCLEYLDENTSLIHYTDMDMQPWLRDGNPNAGIWYTYLWRYIQQQCGQDVLRREIRCHHVRPALEEILKYGPSVSSFSSKARFKDLFFVPPHRFKRISSKKLRKLLSPALQIIIKLQFWMSNGQPNIR